MGLNPYAVKRKCAEAIAAKFGSETSLHFIDYLHQKWENEEEYERFLKQHMRAMLELGWHQPPKIDQVTRDQEGWVSIDHLGFSDSHGLRGRPKQVSIMEVATNIVDSTFRSVGQPISIMFNEPCGTALSAFTVRHVVGFLVKKINLFATIFPFCILMSVMLISKNNLH